MSETKIVTVDFDKMINRCSNFFNNVCETETEERVFDEAYYLELEEKEKQESFKNSGVGAKYLNMRLSDYETPTEEQKEILKKIKAFIADVTDFHFKTLWLCGNSGTGKTMLAAMVVRECGGYFVKSYQIANEIEDSRSFKAKESKTDIIQRYAKYKLLVIDEIGKFEQRQGFELEYLFQILNERYENELSTIIISNKSKKELKEYLGIPIYDRFVENCTSIEFNTSSWRIKNREGEKKSEHQN